MADDIKKTVIDGFFKFLIALVIALVPIILGTKISAAQEAASNAHAITEVIELYDLINQERDIVVKKEFIELWLRLNPTEELDSTIRTMLDDLEKNTAKIAESNTSVLNAINNLSDTYQGKGEFDSVTLNTMNTNFQEYFTLQKQFAESYGTLPLSVETIPNPPKYLNDEEVKTLEDVLQSRAAEPLNQEEEKILDNILRRAEPIVPEELYIPKEQLRPMIGMPGNIIHQRQ